jgi:hypothetical protein
MYKSMKPYYLSRIVFSVAFGVLLFATGSTIWFALLISALLISFFIWAPYGGRYSVHPEFGITALRRDEGTQTINDKAARNAFIVSMLTVAAIIIWFGSFSTISISISIFKIVLLAGAIAYLISDLWLRKIQQ